MRHKTLVVALFLSLAHSYEAVAIELPLNPLGYSIKEVADIYVGSNDPVDSNELDKALLKIYLRGVVDASLMNVGLEMERRKATEAQITWCFETTSSWDWGMLITNVIVDGVDDESQPITEAIAESIAATCTRDLKEL